MDSARTTPRQNLWYKCELPGHLETHKAKRTCNSIAGSDTTVGALRSIIAHIITSPALCRRVQEEIDNAVADGRVSAPVTDAEARKLPLLQACIKEGLRIWPPITAPTPRVSSVDATVCGVHIPAGTNVCWSARAILRNTNVFGSDAEVFRADRWLQADEKQLQAMNETIDLCFAHGKSGCLGRPIAMIELNKATVEVSLSRDLIWDDRWSFLFH